ncbi:MAG: HipA domain-containing protein [Vampirovibrionales bacterium]|nr:HipA domain-containing protein [Vampirovibrionales bacterium]
MDNKENIEVYIDYLFGLKRVGTLYRHTRKGSEAVSFEYYDQWLTDKRGFSLEPMLTLNRGAFSPMPGMSLFGSIGDSAPDTWGRRLMQRAERRRAQREGRALRTLMEADYLLGVSDVSRLGALRFRLSGDKDEGNNKVFRSAATGGVPQLVALGELLHVSERILRDEETDDDIQIIFAPGSSLGGARPKASVMDQHQQLAISKFPKETDDYSVERWEAVAMSLAAKAGIRTAQTELIDVAGRPVLLSRRFDRAAGNRIPFLSALSMMGLKDGERGSYPEMVDVLSQYGAQVSVDVRELYRRMVFNVLISNVDDHLRNHGFLWVGDKGWALSPVYDLNPTPVDVKPRILTTNISLDESTCDLDLVLSVGELFSLSLVEATAIIKQVAAVTNTWRQTAREFAARPSEIERMQSAFEHEDLARALRL